MNRYAVIAIFVTIMVLALGGMHTHLMDLKKAKMAEKKKVKVERVKQEVEEEVVDEDLELEFDTALEEEVEDVIEEQSVEERLKKVEVPKVREDKKETFDKPKYEGKTTLKQDISKKQKKNLKSAPLNKKKSGVVVKNGCQRIEDGRFFVTYEFNSKKNSKPSNLNFHLDFNDASVSAPSNSSKSRSNYVGDNFNWENANLYCENKGFKLLAESQFMLVYQLQKEVCDMNFASDEYWATTETPNKASVCSMATGQCREVDLVETMKTELHRVRCVD